MAEGRFAGQVVAITGAAGGLGSAMARAFAAEGAQLALSDIDTRAVEALAARIGPEGLARGVDVRDWAAQAAFVKMALDRFGRLDVAINNAGIAHALAPMHHIPEDAFDKVMAVNVRGVFLGMKAQLPVMIGAGDGVILNVASAAGLVGAGQMAAYAASKHAVVGLTRSAADEVARHGVRVNALCPAFFDTSMLGAMTQEVTARTGLPPEQAQSRIAARIPMRRAASVAEIVPTILWACDKSNTFLTGQAIALDGGLTAV